MYEWDDIYDDDYLNGMCKVCEVNYADNPHLLCEECAEEAYNNTYALEEWIDNDGFDDETGIEDIAIAMNVNAIRKDKENGNNL